MEADYAFSYDFIKGVFYNCSICSYAWRTRCTGNSPRSCPNCGSRLWKESYSHKCVKCDHEWTTSRKNVKKCPSCQSMKWSGEEPEDELCSNLTDEQRERILARYELGSGTVRISRELQITFSDVFDLLRSLYPDIEVKL